MNPDMFTQLGIAGAAISLLYIFMKELFKYLRERGKHDGTKDSKFDRLCDKIDILVESQNNVILKITEAILRTNNGQDDLLNQMNMHFEMLMKIQEAVQRIDERTRQYAILTDEKGA